MREAEPTYATEPHSRSRGWWKEIEAAGDRLGTPLIPWQRRAARLVGEIRSDGAPRYNLVIVSVPRQSGKSQLAKAATVAKLERTPAGRGYGTAQNRIYAVRHLETLALQLGPRFKSRLGVGNERIIFPNGSHYEVIAPTVSGGHGDSIDWMLVDEGWMLEPHVLGGLRPAMVARPDSQMLVISTMGTVESDVWNELVRLGRESIEEPESRTAYLEYSAPSEEAVFDRASWPDFMPALRHFRGMEEKIAEEMRLLRPAEFMRAFGNRTVASLSIVFPEEWLEAAWRSGLAPAHRLVLGVDISEEPPGASIASATVNEAGLVEIRILEWRYGSSSWLLPLLEQLISKRHVEAIAGDFGGPARVVHAELVALCEHRGIPLIDRRPRDLGADTGGFYNALRDHEILLERSEPLELALKGAARKNLGELWVPHRRRMLADASPLMAAIIGYGVAREFALAPRLPAIY